MPFGLTYHSQTGEPQKLHDVTCSYYARAGKTKELLLPDAIEWLGNNPDGFCGKCITLPLEDAGEVGERAEDPVDHILFPSSLLNDVLKGKRVKAVCGAWITHQSRRGKPICRKCFRTHFGKG